MIPSDLYPRLEVQGKQNHCRGLKENTVLKRPPGPVGMEMKRNL